MLIFAKKHFITAIAQLGERWTEDPEALVRFQVVVFFLHVSRFEMAMFIFKQL